MSRRRTFSRDDSTIPVSSPALAMLPASSFSEAIHNPGPLQVTRNVFDLARPLSRPPVQSSLYPSLSSPVGLTDPAQYEKLVCRTKYPWLRERHPTQFQWIFAASNTLNKYGAPRKCVYINFPILIVIFAWAIYLLFDGNTFFRDKLYPAFSAADKQDHLFFIENITNGIFFGLLALLSSGAFYIGHTHDKQIARRANRHLTNYLITKKSLAATNDMMDEREKAAVYRANYRLLRDWLPNYFDTLLLKKDWEAVIAVILNVAEYIHHNKVMETLGHLQPADSLGLSDEKHSEEEKTSAFTPQGAAQQGIIAALTQRAAVITQANSTAPAIVIAGPHTREIMRETQRILHDHEARLRQLEQLAGHASSPETPEEISQFPLQLIRHCKVLMTDEALTFRIPPKERAWVLSTLFLDSYFLDNLPISDYIGAFFYEWRDERGNIIPPNTRTNAQKQAFTEDRETFSALPVSHQSLIIRHEKISLGVTFFWDNAFTPSQRNALLLQLCEDDVDPAILARLIQGGTEENATADQLKRIAQFCSLYPQTAGVVFAHLLASDNPHINIIKFVFNIFWHASIQNEHRKTITICLENQNEGIGKCSYIFGHDVSKNKIEGLDLYEQLRTRDAYTLMAEVIEECFLHQARETQRSIDKTLAKNPRANVAADKAAVENLLRRAYHLTDLLLESPSDALTADPIQKFLLAILASINQYNKHDEQSALINSILVQFFRAKDHFNIKNAAQLIPFIPRARITSSIQSLWSSDAAPRCRLAAALIYAYYQQGKPGIFQILFHCTRKLPEELKGTITEIIAALQLAHNDQSLIQAFTDLGLPHLPIEISNAMSDSDESQIPKDPRDSEEEKDHPSTPTSATRLVTDGSSGYGTATPINRTRALRDIMTNAAAGSVARSLVFEADNEPPDNEPPDLET